MVAVSKKEAQILQGESAIYDVFKNDNYSVQLAKLAKVDSVLKNEKQKSKDD